MCNVKEATQENYHQLRSSSFTTQIHVPLVVFGFIADDLLFKWIVVKVKELICAQLRLGFSRLALNLALW